VTRGWGKMKMREQSQPKNMKKRYNRSRFPKTFIVNILKLDLSKFWFDFLMSGLSQHQIYKLQTIFNHMNHCNEAATKSQLDSKMTSTPFFKLFCHRKQKLRL